jgi:hypothetical protein
MVYFIKIIKIFILLYISDVLWPDLLQPDLSYPGPFVAGSFVVGPFVAGPFVAGRFVGAAVRVRCRSVGSASGCWKAGPSLILGSAPHGSISY